MWLAHNLVKQNSVQSNGLCVALVDARNRSLVPIRKKYMAVRFLKLLRNMTQDGG